MTLRELAERLGCTLEGDGDAEVSRVAGIDEAGPGDVTFFVNPRYLPSLERTRATAVILGPDAPAAPSTTLRTSEPYVAFARAVTLLHPVSAPAAGVHSSAVVSADAVLGEGVSIGPLAVIGSGAKIGARTIVAAHAMIGEDAVVGEDCVIHSHVALRERVSARRSRRHSERRRDWW